MSFKSKSCGLYKKGNQILISKNYSYFSINMPINLQNLHDLKKIMSENLIKKH